MGKRLKVLIVGLPLFAERLQKDLSSFDKENTYYWLNTYYNKLDKIKARLLIPTVDVVYSINGTLGKSRVFDLALKKNKKLMMTWVGTDVTKSKQIANPSLDYLNKAYHFCEVSWIQEELRDMNIEARILNFFNFTKDIPYVFPSNKTLSILSYVASGREEYYGYSKLMAVAKAHPDVNFTIVGSEGLDDVLDNVSFLGWVDNMPELMDKHHACARLVEHDGLSGFVLESLLKARQVIYSEPLNFTLRAQNKDTLIEKIEFLKNQLKSGTSLENKEGRDFVQTTFNREKILGELIQEFKR